MALWRTPFDAGGRRFEYVVSAYLSNRCCLLRRAQDEVLLALEAAVPELTHAKHYG